MARATELIIAVIIVTVIAVVAAYVWFARQTPPVTPPKGPCKTDADCPPGTVCRGGQCDPGGCARGCPPGQSCYQGACVGDACTRNSDCPAGQRCLPAGTTPGQYACKGGCVRAEDCPAGEQCKDGVCVPPECDVGTGDGCPPGQSCQAGVCRPAACRSADDCPAGQECEGGACIGPSCLSSVECPAGQRCLNAAGCPPPGPGGAGAGACRYGTCVGGCRTAGGSADCPAGQKCEGGTCAPLVTCSSQSDCPVGTSCVALPGGGGVKTCAPSKPCPTVTMPKSGQKYALFNQKVGQNILFGVPGTKAASPPAAMFARGTGGGAGLQQVEIVPVTTSAPSEGRTVLIKFPYGGLDITRPAFLVRDPADPEMPYLRQADAASATYAASAAYAAYATYDPAADPDAHWVYTDGGVITDPGHTVVLGAASCAATPPPPSCAAVSWLPKLKPPTDKRGGPFLATYDPYACQQDKFVWTFGS